MVSRKVLFCFCFVFCLIEAAVVVNVYGEEDDVALTNLIYDMQVSSCDNQACNQFCRSHFYASGACLPSGKCHCYKFKDSDVAADSDVPMTSNLKDALNTKERIDFSGCNVSACDQSCRKRGFERGVCLSDGKCLCSGGLLPDSILPTTSFVNEPSKRQKMEFSSCSMSACNQLCKRLGFKSGVCLPNGKCHCYIFEVSDATGQSADNDYFHYQSNTATESEESTNNVELKLFDCQLRPCDEFCRRLGFPGGACIHGRCDCDRFKGETRNPLQLPCNGMECSRMCRREGHLGGWCRLSGCECY